MMRALQILILIVIFSLLSATGHAGLIANGSFESSDESQRNPHYGSNNTWQIYTSLPDWQASRTIETWRSGFNGVTAQHGQRFIELNAHGGNRNRDFSIYQSFATQVGKTYELSFWARARQSHAERFAVSAGNLHAQITQHIRQNWRRFVFSFQAQSDWTRLSFTSLDGRTDTTGNLIDNVAVAQVPEPDTLALMTLGLLGLVSLSRHKRKTAIARQANSG